MQTLFLSDTHWELHNYINEISFSNIDLIVFLWDNYVEDLELLKNINIKKIGVLWNHTPYENTKQKIDIFETYNIENIEWKIFEFNNYTFLWIPWKTKYLFYETLKDKQKSLKPNQEKINEIEKELNEFMNKKADIIISHFPCFWIMDNPASMSHRWLKVLEKYIEMNNPRYLFHWHLHTQKEEIFIETKIIQVYPYLISKI